MAAVVPGRVSDEAVIATDPAPNVAADQAQKLRSTPDRQAALQAPEHGAGDANHIPLGQAPPPQMSSTIFHTTRT